MNRCPLTYEYCGEENYSRKGLKLLSPVLTNLELLNYTSRELLDEARERAQKLSIQGVQPKLSAVLNIRDRKFELVDQNGRFILKPQHPVYSELPENEDLTMRLAAMTGIDVPLHGLIYARDGSLNYIIKRFDREGQKDKVAVEDFAQLAGLSRDILVEYFGKDRCRLTDIVIEKTMESIQSAMNSWPEMINKSFLSDQLKEKYRNLVSIRASVMGFSFTPHRAS